MKKLLITGLVFVALSGCSGSGNDKEKRQQSFKGVVDELSYTSPNGWFTVYIKEVIARNSLEEKAQSESSQVQLIFDDKEKNRFSIKASYAPEDLPGNFIDEEVNQAQQKGVRALKAKTPDGRHDCFIAAVLVKEENSEKVYGKMNMVFQKDKVIFDLAVITKPYEEPKIASMAIDSQIQQLWRLSRLRGMPKDMPLLVGQKDPRLPVAMIAANKAAAKYGLKGHIEDKEELAFQVVARGENGPVKLRISIHAVHDALNLDKKISFEKGDEKTAAIIEENFSSAFEQALEHEKLAISWSQKPQE